jgi:hypothetical protein
MVRKANQSALEAQRRMTRHERISPDDLIQRKLIIRPDGQEHWVPPIQDPNQPPVPAEIWIRFSEPQKQSHVGPLTASESWDFSRWLQVAQARWADRKIDIYFLSFDPVPIRPEVFDRLRTLHDRGLRWQTRLLTDGKNITSTAILDQLLRSGLDELQVYLAGVGEPVVSQRVLGAVKDFVDLRAARRQNHPKIIGRLCPDPTGQAKQIAELSQWAKQVGIDRLEVTDKETEEKRLWGL